MTVSSETNEVNRSLAALPENLCKHALILAVISYKHCYNLHYQMDICMHIHEHVIVNIYATKDIFSKMIYIWILL